MKPQIIPTGTLQMVKNFTAIREALCGGLGLDNFAGYTITGTTSSTPDSEQRFNHGLKPQPAGGWPIVGDVYVQNINEKYIDVRSTKPSVPFVLFLITSSDARTTSVAPVAGSQTTQQFINFIIENGGDGSGGGTTVNQGIAVEFTTNQKANVTSSTAVLQAVMTDEYFMWASGGTNVYRLEKATGLVVEVGVTRNMGTMCLDPDGQHVWVTETDGSNNGDSKKIEIASWTVVLSETAGGIPDNPTQTLCDAVYLYRGGRSTVGSDRCIITRKTNGSNTATEFTIGANADTNGGVRCFVKTPSEFYVTCTTNTSNLYYTDANLGSVASVAAPTATGRQLRQIGYDGQFIYVVYLLATTSASAASYPQTLLVFDPSSHTFVDEIVLPTMGPIDDKNFVISNDGYAYLMAGLSTQYGMEVIRVDLEDRSVKTRWYPFPFAASQPINTPNTITQLHHALFVDSEDVPYVLLKAPHTGFNYFSPNFDEEQ